MAIGRIDPQTAQFIPACASTVVRGKSCAFPRRRNKGPVRRVLFATTIALSILLMSCQTQQVMPPPELDITPLEFFSTNEQGELWVESKGEVTFLVSATDGAVKGGFEKIQEGLLLEFQHDGQRLRLPTRWSKPQSRDGFVSARVTTVDLALPVDRVGRLVFIDRSDRAYRRFRTRVVCDASSCRGLAVLPADRGRKRERLEKLMTSRDVEALHAARSLAELAQNEGPERAEEAWARTAEVAMRLRLTSQRARSHLLASHYALLGLRLESARMHLSLAEKLWSELDDPRGDVRVAHMWARLAQALGRHVPAIAGQQGVADRAAAVGLDSLRCVAFDDLGLLMGETGRHSEAARYHKSSIECRKSLGDFGDRQARSLLIHLGWALLHAAHQTGGEDYLAKAQSAFLEAGAAAERINDNLGQARATASEAWLFWEAGDAVRAGEYLRRAYALGGHALDREWPSLRTLEGRVHLAARAPEAALSAFEQAIAESDAALVRERVDVPWEAYFGAAQAYVMLDELEDARAQFESGMQMLRTSVRAEVLPGGPRRRLQEPEAAVDAYVRFLLEQGEYVRAFEVLDFMRGVAFRSLRRESIRYSLSREGEAKWIELLDRRQNASQRLEEAIARCSKVPSDQLTDCRAQVKRQEETTRAAFDRVVAFFEETEGSDAITLVEDLRRRLKSDESVALVHGLPDRRFVLRLTSLGVHFAWLDTDDSSDRAALGDFAALGATPGSHLYWVSSTAPPDEVLAQVSLSLLPYAGALRTIPNASGDDYSALVVGDPVLDLPAARAEARAVTELLKTGPDGEQHGVVLLHGETASVERVREGLRRVGVFHFAGDGALRDTSPFEAYLRAANTTRLSLHELAQMKLAAPLVFLSGAFVRSGPSSRDSALGVVDAFLTAGARTVVAAVEEVSEADALHFAELFYRARGAYEPARATFVATSVMRDEGNEAWRAFRVYGRR